MVVDASPSAAPGGVPSRPSDSTIYIGRAPIFDVRGAVVAYELQHRSAPDAGASGDDQVADPVQATHELVERSLLQWGFDRLLEGKPGVLHVDARFLGAGLHLTLPAERVLLELRDDVDPDGILYVHALDATTAGYRLALRHVRDRQRPLSVDLLAMASVVKVDLRATPDSDLATTVRALRMQAPDAELLAEGVDQRDQFERCRAAGFDLFQGYFFATPEVLTRTARRVDSTAALALLAEVQRPDVTLRRMEELVVADPTLAFRLLALVNSSLVGLSSRVESVYHAIVLLGVEKVRQLAILITMASRSKEHGELLTLAATRAWMARALVGTPDLESSAYTAGLLSLIDVIFATPMADLVAELPLSDAVAEALREGTGRLGELLASIVAYERNDLDELERLRPGELSTYVICYREASTWAQELRLQLAG
jgi:EAL and modified HD-GYP domain-containing signal transduction protein